MKEHSDVSDKIADIITMVLFDRLNDEGREGEGQGGSSNVRKKSSSSKSKSKKPQKEKPEDEEKEDEDKSESEDSGERESEDSGERESEDSGEGEGDGDGEGDGEGEGAEASGEDDEEEEGEEEGDGEGDSDEGEGDGEGDEDEDESEGEDYANGAGGRSIIAGLDYKETILLGGGVISASSEARSTRLRRINYDDLLYQSMSEHIPKTVRDKVKITQNIRKIATIFARSTKLPRRTEAAYTPSSSGRFNVRKAHRLEMPDNLRMFKARKGIEAPSAEIVILVDASGSTRTDSLQDYGESILQSFTTVAAILYTGLKMIDIPVRIMAYGGNGWQWMDLEGKGGAIVVPEVEGGTPTDAAIRQAFEVVLKDSKARVRIVANLTDGVPNRPGAVRSTVEYLAVQGVHTLGCYLGRLAGTYEMGIMVGQYGEGKAIVGNNTNIFIAQIAQAMRYVASLK